MMMALAGCADLPAVLVPGGVTLPAEDGEDAGKVQTIGARFAHGRDHARARPRSWAAAPAPRPAAAASSWARRPRRRWSARRSACRCRTRRSRRRASRSGSTWRGARRAPSLRARARGHRRRATSSPTRALDNAMVVHAAFGGSTNLLLHLPAIAHAAGLRRPTRRGLGRASTAQVPRLVDVLPNGPRRPPDGARLPRRRRAGGDAAPAPRWACWNSSALTATGEHARRRARLVGAVASAARRLRAAPARARRRRSRRRDHATRTARAARA